MSVYDSAQSILKSVAAGRFDVGRLEIVSELYPFANCAILTPLFLRLPTSPLQSNFSDTHTMFLSMLVKPATAREKIVCAINGMIFRCNLSHPFDCKCLMTPLIVAESALFKDQQCTSDDDEMHKIMPKTKHSCVKNNIITFWFAVNKYEAIKSSSKLPFPLGCVCGLGKKRN